MLQVEVNATGGNSTAIFKVVNREKLPSPLPMLKFEIYFAFVSYSFLIGFIYYCLHQLMTVLLISLIAWNPYKVLNIFCHHHWIAVAYAHCVCCYRCAILQNNYFRQILIG